MPTISIKKNYFNKLIGKELSFRQFEEICFDFGLEAEEDTDNPGYIKVELPANRYDLFCTEGLALTLNKYLETGGESKVQSLTRDYKCLPPKTHIEIDESVKSIRPFVVCGIIRNVYFDKDIYESFIDFQDKLHHNLGRKRTLVSIGTHDLDKVKPPFKYTAKRKSDFSFVPLGKNQSYICSDLLKVYETDFHLKNYLHIIEQSEFAPLIMDAEDRILSMPPIINSEFSKIDLNTKNLFIDITATDKTKALIALNVIVSSFSLFSQQQFTFEQVEIRDGEDRAVSPLVPIIKEFYCKKSYLENMIGMTISSDKIISYLGKMGLNATLDLQKKEVFKVEVPFYRTDVMHPCDIAEDLAISIGYDNVPFVEPDILCNGAQVPLNKMTELTRIEMSNAGYTECLNFALCSINDLTVHLLKKSDEKMVEIANPKTLDFQVGRTTLLTGIIKTIVSNKSNELPIRLFEISDVVLLDKEKWHKGKTGITDYYAQYEKIGAINQRRICFAYTNTGTAGLELLHGTMDLLFKKMFGSKLVYELKENGMPFLFGKLQAGVYVNGEKIGDMGVVHPEILKQFKWPYPISMIELNFEKLVDFYFSKSN